MSDFPFLGVGSIHFGGRRRELTCFTSSRCLPPSRSILCDLVGYPNPAVKRGAERGAILTGSGRIVLKTALEKGLYRPKFKPDIALGCSRQR